MKHTWNMHTKILVLCLGITLVALILQTFLFQKSSSEQIYTQSKNESYNSLQNMQNDLYSYIKRIESGLIRTYHEDMLILDMKNKMPIDQMREKYHRIGYSMGVTNFDTSDGVIALYLYNMSDEIISTYRRANTPKHNYPLDIYEDEAEYNSARVKAYVHSDDTTMLISSYYNQSRESNIVRFVLKLYRNSNIRQQIGYIVCDTDSKVIRYCMEKYRVDKDIFMWIQPYGDYPIVSIGTLKEGENEEFKQLEQSIEQGNAIFSEVPSNVDKAFFKVNQSKYNLGAYSLMPQSFLIKNQQVLTKNLILIVVVMSMFAVIITLNVSKSLTKPLEEMSVMAKKIKEGNTKLRMQNLRDDEVGGLGQSFNEMLDQIEELISREYETKLMINRAEYNALQAQINPHFLYNTLDTMESIAQLQGCQQVSDLCQSLSNIFRYSLDMKNPFSTLSKEIIHLKNYIYVMNIRMQNQISYEFDIEEELRNDTLPRISIQPLVENSINHGLRNARGEKKVWIQAKKKGKNLQIIVDDNGIGIEEEKIIQLFEQEEKMESKKRSIGLNNINMRMKMLYGESYGIQIESKVGEGTRVILEIPRYTMEEMMLWTQKSINF